MDSRASFSVLVLTSFILHMTSGQDLNGCGVTKGCFQQPSTCTGNDCTAYVTWETTQGGQTRFSMRAESSAGLAWVAVGLRPTGTSGMSPADVYACTSNSEVKRSENVNPYNSEPRIIPSGTVTTESATFQNNVISCVFTRQASLAGDTTFYNISGDNQYFILMAYGTNINSDGSIHGFVHQDVWASAQAQMLSTYGSITPLTENEALPKAHACLMVIAWVGFASIGITMARFFKPMWPTSTLLGEKVWFTIHRTCMVTCVLCFCTAFILIFVSVSGFMDPAEPLEFTHGICGVLVTCLGLINPIMAIFRPHPGTPNRPIFNWAHWSVGTFAHLLALVNVLLGIGYRSSILDGLANYAFYVMIVFTAFHIVMWILFEVQRRMAESQDHSYDMAMKTADDSNQQLDSPVVNSPSGSTAKITLLCVYVVGVVISVTILVVAIAVAGI